MTQNRIAPPRWFRVWIARFENWAPTDWSEAPPRATVIELVEDDYFSAEHATALVEGFNTNALLLKERRWAIAVPVELRFQGDLRVGETVLEGVARRACQRHAPPMFAT